jgi:hypothetical protein
MLFCCVCRSNVLRDCSVCISRSKVSNNSPWPWTHTMLLQELHTQQHSMKTHQKICIKSQRHSGFCTSQAEARKNERSQLRQIMMKDKHMIQQSQYIWYSRANTYDTAEPIHIIQQSQYIWYSRANTYGSKCKVIVLTLTQTQTQSTAIKWN